MVHIQVKVTFEPDGNAFLAQSAVLNDWHQSGLVKNIYRVNIQKSVVFPTQHIELLGFYIDTMSMVVTLTEKKCSKLPAKTEVLIQKTRPTIQDMIFAGTGRRFQSLFSMLHNTNIIQEWSNNNAVMMASRKLSAKLTLLLRDGYWCDVWSIRTKIQPLLSRFQWSHAYLWVFLWELDGLAVRKLVRPVGHLSTDEAKCNIKVKALLATECPHASVFRQWQGNQGPRPLQWQTVDTEWYNRNPLIGLFMKWPLTFATQYQFCPMTGFTAK